MDMVFVLVTVLRLVVPFCILRYPFAGLLLAIGADSLDWHVLHLQTSHDYAFYQQWDKVLDTYYLAFAAYMTLQWKEIAAKRIAVGLYLYRFVGALLFEITHFRILLFLFPNLFENFYLFYYVSRYFLSGQKNKKVYRYSSLSLILLVLLIPKLLQEYMIHVAKQLPWQAISFHIGLVADQLIWTSLYLVLPAITLRYMMRTPVAHR